MSAKQSRRRYLQQTAAAAAGATLISSLPAEAKARKGENFRPKAKKVIFLFMAGAPSQLDLFDYKPNLQKLFKTKLPESVSKGQRVTQMTLKAQKLIAPSKFKFSQHGQSGMWLSELLPHLSTVTDDLCLIRSMHTNAINHDPGKTSLCTGSEMAGKPSMGAWLSYGLGAMNQNLPDFVVMPSAFWTGGTGNVQALYSRLWGSGFLPSRYQGVSLQTTGDPVLFLSNPPGVDRKVRRRMLDAIGEINRKHHQQIGDPEIATTVAQQEMAYRMQDSVPELTDIRHEPKHVLDMYGPEVHKQGSFARNCLLARRMVERDVRFIQLFHRGWDHHVHLPKKIKGQSYDVDQASKGLITDLKQRGLLDETLIVFVGEFGRTVYCQGRLSRDNYGRDHHPRCFSTWLAGGGIKGGVTYGKTDDFSYNIDENPVSVADLHGTMLHLMGIDHKKLNFPFQGLDQRLTGVEDAKIIKDIIA